MLKPLVMAMALGDRFKRVLDNAATRAVDALAARSRGNALTGGPRDLSLQANIPNPFGGEPLARLRLQVTTERQAHGETLRLRAHLKTQLEIPDEQRLALTDTSSPAESTGRALAPRAQQAARSLLRRGLQTAIARRVTPYLERRFESWVDVQAATVPLDRGAQALVPDAMQVLGLGRAPALRLGDDGQIETWIGRCTGERAGNAQVTLMQFSEGRNEPDRKSGRKPLHVAASVASFYEDPRRRR